MVSHSNHPASPAAQPGSVDSASSGQSADELKRNIQWKEIYEQNLSIISELMLSGIHLKLHSNILIYNWNPNQELHNNNFTIVFVTIPSLLGGVLLSTLLVVCFKVWKQRLMSGYVHYECCIYIYAQQSKSALCAARQVTDGTAQVSDTLLTPIKAQSDCCWQVRRLKRLEVTFLCWHILDIFLVLQAKNQRAVWDAAPSQINKLLWI